MGNGGGWAASVALVLGEVIAVRGEGTFGGIHFGALDAFVGLVAAVEVAIMNAGEAWILATSSRLGR